MQRYNRETSILLQCTVVRYIYMGDLGEGREAWSPVAEWLKIIKYLLRYTAVQW